jgi:preprotein translocase subunit SecY
MGNAGLVDCITGCRSLCSAIGIFLGAFAAVTLGIVYVQEAERQIPIVYASKQAPVAPMATHGRM